MFVRGKKKKDRPFKAKSVVLVFCFFPLSNLQDYLLIVYHLWFPVNRGSPLPGTQLHTFHSFKELSLLLLNVCLGGFVNMILY